MRKPMDEREKRLAQLRREVTGRSFDRHASVLKDVSELPLEFQTSAVLELAERETIQSIILFPPQLRGRNYVPKQALLFASNGMLHLMSSIWPDQAPQATYVDACDLMYMDITLILLYGFLEIVAHGQASSTRLGMEFNTVGWVLLTKPLRKLLQAGQVIPGSWPEESQYPPVMERAVEGLPVKFANGTKLYGLLPGEQLEDLVFQPGTSKPWLHFFRRPLTPNTILLLTSHYVVVIREDLIVSQGWILTYLPRECVVQMWAQPCELCEELIFSLKRENQTAEFRLPLASDAVKAWHARWIQHGGQWRDSGN